MRTFILMASLILGGSALAAFEPPEAGVGPPDDIVNTAILEHQDARLDISILEIAATEAPEEPAPAMAEPSIEATPELPDAPPEVVAARCEAMAIPLAPFSYEIKSFEREPFAPYRSEGLELARQIKRPPAKHSAHVSTAAGLPFLAGA